MKNSKNPHTHFSAKIRYIGKAGPIRVERAVRAAHIAKALSWPTPLPKFPTCALWRSFSLSFEGNRVFQHNRRRTAVRCKCEPGMRPFGKPTFKRLMKFGSGSALYRCAHLAASVFDEPRAAFKKLQAKGKNRVTERFSIITQEGRRTTIGADGRIIHRGREISAFTGLSRVRGLRRESDEPTL